MTMDVKNSEDTIPTTIQQEYKILAEYKMIESEKIGGVYVIPSYKNSLLWYGVIFIRQGFYADAIFRFTIVLPEYFPDDKALPNVIFQNEVFHPLVCPFTGVFDITHGFPCWRTGEDHIWQLLKYIQSAFLQPLNTLKYATSVSTTGKLSNGEAAELLTQNRAEFIGRVKCCVNSSKEHIYDPPTVDDPHYITFENFDDGVHGPILERIRQGKAKDLGITPSSTATGLSWMKEGEFKPLSVE